MRSVLGVYLSFLKYQEDSKRYLNTIHVVLHGGGMKTYRNVPFLGMHQLIHLPGKDKRAKKKPKTIHEKKKPPSTTEACVAVSPSRSYENTFSKF